MIKILVCFDVILTINFDQTLLNSDLCVTMNEQEGSGFFGGGNKVEIAKNEY